MKLCYIADANSIHTHRWLAPFTEQAHGGQQAHQVTVLSYRPVDNPPPNATVIDLTELSNVPKLRFVHWGWWIHRYLKECKPDILHAHQIQAAGWLGAMSGYHPFIVSAWGSDILVEPHHSRLRRLLVKFVLNRADWLTVPSRLMCDVALDLSFPEERLRLIPWGVETHVYQPTPNDQRETRTRFGVDLAAPVILCPRGISAIYNHDILLDAVADIAEQIATVQVIFLHYNVNIDYHDALLQQIEDRGLAERVHWLPPQETGLEMARLYRIADIVVSIPSSDGYGFTVYEAMASGIPTIVSDLPLFQDELENDLHTLKVPVRNRVATVRTLLQLLTDNRTQRTLRENGLMVCKDKNVKNRAVRSFALYKKALL